MNLLLKIVGVALLMYGVATGLGRVLGGELWLGFVLTGGVLLVGEWIASIRAAARRKSDYVHVKALLDALNVGRLTQKYPLHAAGIAGAVGFMMAGGKTSSHTPLYDMAVHVTEEIVKASLAQCQHDAKQQPAT